ncbi:hypothetical protein [Spiroplasma endosymbiont of Stenodema calcarata]|uniref:hypothetical protein n=1 Tax=Spiroplasma endosymbiont of Stenodema calcarata TaxID=3139328 RepID=UPI003CCB60AD
MMLLSNIKTIIAELNQTNVKLSQYQNFQLWIIKVTEKSEIITLELLTIEDSEDSAYHVIATIDIALTKQEDLIWYYESLLLAQQQTAAKVAFWRKLTQQAKPLYQLETSSNIYRLTKIGINFFKDNTIETELNYCNYNILTILISFRKINNFKNSNDLKSCNQVNLIEEIKKSLAAMQLITYKLLLIEGCVSYHLEINWLTNTGQFLIKTNATIYYQVNLTIKTEQKILEQLLNLIQLITKLNERTLEYFRTLLLLTHQQQLFIFNKKTDCWIQTPLGQKLFYQIDYPKFIINQEMMKFNLEKGI